MTKEILEKSYNHLKPSCNIMSQREDIGRGFSIITTHYMGGYAGKEAAGEILQWARELKMNSRVLKADYVMVKEYVNSEGVTIGGKACFVMGEETYVMYDITIAKVDELTFTLVTMTSNGPVGMS